MPLNGPDKIIIFSMNNHLSRGTCIKGNNSLLFYFYAILSISKTNLKLLSICFAVDLIIQGIIITTIIICS